MPQMAPMNWVTMFLYTILLMMMTSTVLYFMFQSKPFKLLKKKMIKINWKW